MWLLLFAVLITTGAAAALYSPTTAGSDAATLRKQKAKIELKKNQEQQNKTSLRATEITAGTYGAGDYSLTNATLTGQLHFNGNATLTISGANTITTAGTGVSIANGASLTIQSADDGSLAVTSTVTSGEVIAIYNGGSLTITSGTVSATSSTQSGHDAWGLFNDGGAGNPGSVTFTQNGGTLKLGGTTGLQNSGGGLININGGTVSDLTGGTATVTNAAGLANVAVAADVDINTGLEVWTASDNTTQLYPPYFTVNPLVSGNASIGDVITVQGTVFEETHTVHSEAQSTVGTNSLKSVHQIVIGGQAVSPTDLTTTSFKFTVPSGLTAGTTYKVYVRYQVATYNSTEYFLTKKIGTITIPTAPAGPVEIATTTTLNSSDVQDREYIVTTNGVELTLNAANLTKKLTINATGVKLILTGGNTITTAGTIGLQVNPGKSLTIEESSTGSLTVTSSAAGEVFAIYNAGTLTLTSGTVTATSSNTTASEAWGVFNDGGANPGGSVTFTQDGGTLKLGGETGLQNSGGGLININGGTVSDLTGGTATVTNAAGLANVAVEADVDINTGLETWKDPSDNTTQLYPPYFNVTTTVSETVSQGTTKDVTVEGTVLTATHNVPNNAQTTLGTATLENVYQIVIEGTAITPTLDGANTTSFTFTIPALSVGTHKVYVRYQVAQYPANSGTKYYLTKKIGTVTVEEAPLGTKTVTIIGDETVVIGKDGDTSSDPLTAQVDNGEPFTFFVDTAVAYEGIPGELVFTGENSRETLDLTPDNATDSVTITVTSDTTILVTYTTYPKVIINADDEVIKVTTTGGEVIPNGDSIYTDQLTGGTVTFKAYVKTATEFHKFLVNDVEKAGTAHTTDPDSLVYTVTVNNLTKDSIVTLKYIDPRVKYSVEVYTGDGVTLVGNSTDSVYGSENYTFKVTVPTLIAGSTIRATSYPANGGSGTQATTTTIPGSGSAPDTIQVTVNNVPGNIWVSVYYTLPAYVGIYGMGGSKLTTDAAAQNVLAYGEHIYASQPGRGTVTFYATVRKNDGWDIKTQTYPTENVETVVTVQNANYSTNPDSVIYKVEVTGDNLSWVDVYYSAKAQVTIHAANVSIQRPNPTSDVVGEGSADNGEFTFTVEIAQALATGGSISVLEGTTGNNELVGREHNNPGGYVPLYATYVVNANDVRKYDVTIHGLTSGDFEARISYVAQPTVHVNTMSGISNVYERYGVATSGTYAFNVDLYSYTNGKLTVTPTDVNDATLTGVTYTVTGESNPYTITLAGLTVTTNVRVEYATQPFNWTVVPANDTVFQTNNAVIANGSDSDGYFGFYKPTPVIPGGKFFYSVIGITGNEQTTLQANVDTIRTSGYVYVELPSTTDNKPVDSVSVIVGYLPPANLPTYTPPVKEPVVVITPADRPVANAAPGEVAINPTKPNQVNENSSLTEAYKNKGSIVPGGKIETTVPVSPEAAVIATPQTVVITFSGPLAVILPSIEVPNVEVNHSELRIVYIFDNSTKSALTTRALETRAARLRAGENTSSYGVYDPETNTLYIHLVDIDIDAIGEGGTSATLDLKDLDIPVGEVNTVVTLYDHPVVLVPDNGVPSIGYPGYFTLSGSYPTDGQLVYRLENDPNTVAAYKSYYPSTGLLQSEIARLANGEKLYFAILGAVEQVGDLYVYIPKTYDNIAGGGSDGGSYIPSLPRNVFISATASSEGLINFNPVSGQGITTDGNFQFTVTPTDPLAGYEIVLHFYKDWITVDANYLPVYDITPHADGSFTVTLANIKVSDLQIVVEYRQGTVGNTNVDADKVWSNNGTLFINSNSNGIAKVYSIAGALVKTVKVEANTLTTAELPQGTYIVTLNGKSSKVNTK